MATASFDPESVSLDKLRAARSMRTMDALHSVNPRIAAEVVRTGSRTDVLRGAGSTTPTPSDSAVETAAATRIQSLARASLAKREFTAALAAKYEEEEAAMDAVRDKQVAEGLKLVQRERAKTAIAEMRMQDANRADTVLLNAGMGSRRSAAARDSDDSDEEGAVVVPVSRAAATALRGVYAAQESDEDEEEVGRGVHRTARSRSASHMTPGAGHSAAAEAAAYAGGGGSHAGMVRKGSLGDSMRSLAALAAEKHAGMSSAEAAAHMSALTRAAAATLPVAAIITAAEAALAHSAQAMASSADFTPDHVIAKSGVHTAHHARDGYRDAGIALAARAPLLPAGLRMPSALLSEMAAPPRDATARNAGPAAPRLTTAKMRSRARAPGEATPIVMMGATGSASSGTHAAISVPTYTPAAVAGMPIPALLEARDTLREALDEANAQLVDLMAAGDRLNADAATLRREIAAMSSGVPIPAEAAPPRLPTQVPTTQSTASEAALTPIRAPPPQIPAPAPASASPMSRIRAALHIPAKLTLGGGGTSGTPATASDAISRTASTGSVGAASTASSVATHEGEPPSSAPPAAAATASAAAQAAAPAAGGTPGRITWPWSRKR